LFFLLHTNYKHCSDEELMLFVAKGKEKAFDELYKRYAKRMLFFFYQRLYQDTEKANDFLQDLFLKIIEKPELYTAGNKFSTWIFTMASNMCKNEYRRNAVRGTKVEQYDFNEIMEEQPYATLTNQHDITYFKKCLTNELNAMEENQSLTFILRHQEHLSIKEISLIMDCSEGTVKSRLFYTIKKLSEKLEMFNVLKESSYGKGA
jgi:RNA polymerase sigma-70 factor, ECF subfamily